MNEYDSITDEEMRQVANGKYTLNTKRWVLENGTP